MNPDHWQIIFIDSDDPHYRVFATISGGYISGDSWRMNSGIVKVEENGDYFDFHGSSGSVYHCHKECYGSNFYGIGVLQSFITQHEGVVTIMPEETDWMKVDWIIS